MADDWEEGGDPWTIKKVRRSYETRWFAVDDHDVINPAGNPGHYGVIRVPRLAVGVLPIEPDGMVHLVGQWRFPLGSLFLGDSRRRQRSGRGAGNDRPSRACRRDWS